MANTCGKYLNFKKDNYGFKILQFLNQKKEIFTPLHEGHVNMYVCGPTVYDHPHIGHAKSYVSFDVIVRYLRYLGYKVRYVQNITDVGHLTDNADTGEDKILKRAQREHVEPAVLVEKYMRSYFEDMDALNNKRPDISPRATAYIPEQIELVEKLIEKGYAYVSNGSVYFDIQKFKEYGKLSGRKQEELDAGARIEINPEKRYPADFALWKKAEPRHIMRWKSSWGEGFPGWHLECSAMSMKYLGQTLDIHGGGLENVFPHHECEIAQSEAANNLPFVRYWIHNNMVTVNGQKMGKSLGNFLLIADLLKRCPVNYIRFFVAKNLWRSPVDYSESVMIEVKSAVDKIEEFLRKLKYVKAVKSDKTLKIEIKKLETNFYNELDDDFNTPKAFAVMFEFINKANILLETNLISRADAKKIYQFFQEINKIFGIINFKKVNRTIPAEIKKLAKQREEYRKNKEWQKADEVRLEIEKKGFYVQDSENGSVIKSI